MIMGIGQAIIIALPLWCIYTILCNIDNKLGKK